MTGAQKYATETLAKLDAALDRGDLGELHEFEGVFAALAAKAVLGRDFEQAREWAELYEAAHSCIEELRARREADTSAWPGVA